MLVFIVNRYLRDHLSKTFVELFGLFGDVDTKYIKDLFKNSINIINAEGSGMKTIGHFFKRKRDVCACASS